MSRDRAVGREAGLNRGAPAAKSAAPPASRREWFRTAARGTLLALLAALSGRLLGRSNACTRRIPCQTCGLLAECELPQARPAQHEQMGRM